MSHIKVFPIGRIGGIPSLAENLLIPPFLAFKQIRIVKVTPPQVLITQQKKYPQQNFTSPVPLNIIWKHCTWCMRTVSFSSLFWRYLVDMKSPPSPPPPPPPRKMGGRQFYWALRDLKFSPTPGRLSQMGV